MRKIIIIVTCIVSLAIAGAATAAPNVQQGVNPELNFMITRILPNGNEQVLGTATVESTTADQIARDTALAASRQNRTNNPSWRIVIYCPTNGPTEWYTDGDRCWDSATDL